MYNQIILVGRIAKEIERDSIVLKVQRSTGTGYNLFTVYAESPLRDHFSELHKNDIVGVKGQLETAANGNLQIIAEKLTFLQSGKK